MLKNISFVLLISLALGTVVKPILINKIKLFGELTAFSEQA